MQDNFPWRIVNSTKTIVAAGTIARRSIFRDRENVDCLAVARQYLSCREYPRRRFPPSFFNSRFFMRRKYGETKFILEHIRSLGYAVSVHRVNGVVEMHAVKLADPNEQRRKATTAPANSRRWWGIDLEDG